MPRHLNCEWCVIPNHNCGTCDRCDFEAHFDDAHWVITHPDGSVICDYCAVAEGLIPARDEVEDEEEGPL